jgi:hypothetical protein
MNGRLTFCLLRDAGAHEDLVAQAVEESRNWKEIERAILEGEILLLCLVVLLV